MTKKNLIIIGIVLLILFVLIKSFQYWNENIRVEGVPIDETIYYFCANGGIGYSTYRDNFDQNYQEWKNMVLNVSPARRRGNIKFIKECYRSKKNFLKTVAPQKLNQMRSQGIPVDKIVEEIKEKDGKQFNISQKKASRYFKNKYNLNDDQLLTIYYDYISAGMELKYYERLFNDLHIDPNQN